MDFNFSTIISVLSYGVIIPFFFGLVFYKYLALKFKLLAALMCIALITEIVANHLSGQRINNLYLIHIYTVIEFVLLGIFYLYSLSDIIKKQYMILIILMYIIFFIISTLFIQKLNEYNDLTRAVKAFILIIFSALYFYKKIRFEENLNRDPVFWVNIGVLFYFTSNFLLFASSNIVLTLPRKSINVLWLIHALFIQIYYLSITIGFIKCKKLEYSR